MPIGVPGGQARPCVSVLEPAGLQVPEAHHQHDPARPHHQVAAAPAQEEEAPEHQRPVPGGRPEAPRAQPEQTRSPGFPPLPVLDVWGWAILPGVGAGQGHPVHYGMLSSITGLHPPDASSILPSSHNRKVSRYYQIPQGRQKKLKNIMSQYVS